MPALHRPWSLWYRQSWQRQLALEAIQLGFPEPLPCVLHQCQRFRQRAQTVEGLASPLIIPTPCQQGIGCEETKTGTPYWDWVRLLDRVFDPDMATCPFCQHGSLRIIAAITHESVITRLLRHLKLASVPPPIASARCRQELFAFDETHVSVGP